MGGSGLFYGSLLNRTSRQVLRHEICARERFVPGVADRISNAYVHAMEFSEMVLSPVTTAISSAKPSTVACRVGPCLGAH